MIDIVDDDVPRPPEGVRPGTTGFHRPSGAAVGSSSKAGSPLPASSRVYLPGWNLSPGSLSSDRVDAYEWCRHAFPPTILESLDLLSYSHMANELQYVATKVSP